jgi:aspartyl-tRNA(Asn)/glutamyl-tRNA(Gln) amidotransferase subunit A
MVRASGPRIGVEGVTLVSNARPQSSIADQLTALSAHEAGQLLAAKKLSPVELTRAHLERIARVDGKINGYITVLDDRAMTKAREAEDEIVKGRYRGPLHGIPYGLKDNYYTKGIRTTAASRLMWNWIPDSDATVHTRLEAAGAILLGKHNTWEFGTGNGRAQDDLPVPAARNAWNQAYTAGGSSSGTGASVAAGLCMIGMGSDTGGSVRIPAALNGLFGLKATYGRISRAGIQPNSFSFDIAGPLTRTVRDNALAMQVIAGHDPLDPTSADEPVPNFTSDLDKGLHGLKLGYIRRYHERDVKPDGAVVAALERAIATCRELGAEIIDIDVPYSVQQARAVVTIIGQSESLAIHEADFRDRQKDMGAALREKFMGSLGISALDFVKATRWRREMTEATRRAFAGVDAVLCASAFYQVPRHDDDDGGIAFTAGSALCCANVTGHPSAVICTGFGPTGLPMSMQILGKHFDEATVLRVGQAYERATEWHKRRPSL